MCIYTKSIVLYAELKPNEGDGNEAKRLLNHHEYTYNFAVYYDRNVTVLIFIKSLYKVD